MRVVPVYLLLTFIVILILFSLFFFEFYDSVFGENSFERKVVSSLENFSSFYEGRENQEVDPKKIEKMLSAD